MKRFDAMYEILRFGNKEEKELLMNGKLDEAYQIEHARNMLIYFLNENPVKKIREEIELMTSYTVDEHGHWNYSVGFVFDEFTRNLLLKLKEKFK